MVSIKEKVSSETIIKNSRFLGFLIPVESEEDAQRILIQARLDHPGANHYCYAYVIGDDGIKQKASDDGEPQKTAGIPMLEILKKNDMTNVLALSIRYFGGVLLGASGLVRAYSKSISSLLGDVIFTHKTVHYRYLLVAEYQAYNRIERLLQENVVLESSSYTDKIQSIFRIESSIAENIVSRISEFLGGHGRIEKTGEHAFYSAD